MVKNFRNQKIQVSFLDVLRFAGSYWVRQPVKLVIIVVMLTGAAFIETYLPTALAEFLSAIKQKSDAAAVYHKLGIFLGAYLGQAIVFSIVYTLYNLFETRIFKNLIDDAFEHVYRLSEHFFVNTFTGSIVSKINRARQRIESFEDQIFHRVLTTAVVLIGSTIFLSLRFPLLGLLLMVYLVLLMGISVFLVFYISGPAQGEYADAQDALTAHLADSISGIATTKSYAREKFEVSKFFSITHNLYLKNLRSYLLSTSSGTMQRLMLAGMLALLLGGGTWYFMHGKASVENMAYLAFAYTIIQSYIRDLGDNIKNILTSSYDLHAVITLMREKPEVTTALPDLDIQSGEIVFDKVRGNNHLMSSNKITRHQAPTQAEKAKTNKLWGGRFATAPDAVMRAINNSLAVDRRMAMQDVRGSIVHAAMLTGHSIISAADGASIHKGLLAIEQELVAGTFPFRDEFEDIHMNIEVRLRELIGDAAGRLHTARSRNDQVVTSFRLWLRDALAELDNSLRELQTALIAQAEQHIETILPGLTHMQPAQPVSFAHHLLAYVEMLSRDRARFAGCAERMNESPLGAAALAGTPFPIDRAQTASALGFARPMANSMDAVSARDFVLEFLSDVAIASVHLSRLAEEMIVWCTPAYGFIELPDHLTTGSSIMPQKRNPDAAELVRGAAGKANGALMQMLTVLKATPLAYNKDFQGDKSATFDAYDTLMLSLSAMTTMVRDLKVNADKMRTACKDGFLTATDLADWLVMELNIPFRAAHHITGQAVALAAKQHKKLNELALAELQKIEPRITAAVFDVLTVEGSLARRQSFGGTSPVRVREAIAAAKSNL